MTCRVARSFRDHSRLDLVSCCECGSTDPSVLSVSMSLGPYLCPVCEQSLIAHGATKEQELEPLRECVSL